MDEGRGTADIEEALLCAFVGRAEEDRAPEVGVSLVGVGGVEVVFKTLSAACCGRGLTTDEAEGIADFCLSSFSLSSELLRRRLVPARTATGGGGLGCSYVAVLGRYLGNDEAIISCFFARRDAARVKIPDLGVL